MNVENRLDLDSNYENSPLDDEETVENEHFTRILPHFLHHRFSNKSNENIQENESENSIPDEPNYNKDYTVDYRERSDSDSDNKIDFKVGEILSSDSIILESQVNSTTESTRKHRFPNILSHLPKPHLPHLHRKSNSNEKDKENNLDKSFHDKNNHSNNQNSEENSVGNTEGLSESDSLGRSRLYSEPISRTGSSNYTESSTNISDMGTPDLRLTQSAKRHHIIPDFLKPRNRKGTHSKSEPPLLIDTSNVPTTSSSSSSSTTFTSTTKEQEFTIKSPKGEKTKKSFFGSLFGTHKKEKPVLDHDAMHDPDLLLSYKFEIENFRITIIVVFGMIIPFFGYLVKFFVKLFLSSTLYYGQPLDFVYSSAVQLCLAFTTIIIVLYFTIHRILGYVVGYVGRYLLCNLVSGKPMSDPKGIWDIHIGWISYRGCLDHNEFVIHHALWRNPKFFTKTPYLIRFKELSASFNLWEFIVLCRDGKDIIFDRIVLDNPEIYFERALPLKKSSPRSRTSSHADLTQKMKDSKDTVDGKIVKDARECEVEGVSDEVGYNTLNVWGAIACETVQQENRMFSGMIHGIVKDIETKISHKFTKTFHKRPVLSKNDQEEEEVDLDEASIKERHNSVCSPIIIHRPYSNSISSNSSASSAISSTSTTTSSTSVTSPNANTKAVKPMPTFVCNRLLILDLLGHPLDLLSGKHMEPSRSTDIYIDICHIVKKDITGKPYHKGDPRRILSAKRFGQMFGDHFAEVLFEKCSMEIANLVAASTANKAMTKLSSIGLLHRDSK